MWHSTSNGALVAALRMIDRRVDPEEIARRAKAAGKRLPVTAQWVSAPSLGGSMKVGHRVEQERLGELRAIVDELMATRAKAA